MSRIVDTYPLSPLQEGMLFNALYAPHSGIDITQIICRMHHPIEVEPFRRAWNEVVARHSILRTAFRWEGLDEPLQDVYETAEIEFMVEDLHGLPESVGEKRLEEHLKADRHRGFDIAKPPLMRVGLFRHSESGTTLVWSLHHLILDAHSFAIVLKEVFEIYEASLAGRAPSLGAPKPYRAYIDWVRTQDVSAAEKFWRDLLSGFTALISFSVAHDPQRLASVRGAFGKRDILLPSEIKPKLKSFAKSNGLTLYTCFQGAWSIILGRYSGSNDVVFASVRGCRGVPIEGAAEIIGMFINTLPVRARIEEDEPIVDFLKELRVQHVSTRAYEHSPLARIQRWSNMPVGMPLFESLMNYESRPWSSVLDSLGGEFLKRRWNVLNQTNIPISIDIFEEPKLRIVMDYDLALFDEPAINAMLGHFRMLLVAMAENPNRSIGELPMLAEEERRRIVVEWNETAADYPRGKTIHGLFAEQAARTPEATAVVLDDRRYTYRELDERSNRLAHKLRALGVGSDVPVAACMDRTPDLVVALLAAMKAGGAYVPLDPAYPRDRLAFMLEDTAAPVLLTEEKLAEFLPEHAAHTIKLDTGWGEVASEPASDPGGGAGADNLAYIIYTSGSTGTPKGVCCRHASVLNLFADFDRRAPIAPGDPCSLWTSVSFDVSVYEIFSALLAGGALHIASDEIRYDSASFIPWLAERRISSVYVPPLMLADLLAWIEKHPGTLVMKRLLVGVEPISEKLLASIIERVPGLTIINGYGPTETTICSTLHTVRPEEARDRIVPIGKPVQNSRVHILDASMRPVPVGVAGEIYIGGEGMARGYLNRPELTSERFIPDPLSGAPGEQLYRTGDRARFLGDGSIEFIGRADYQVKVRGFRVEPGEIERTLEGHPAVTEAVVIAKPDRTGSKRLVAYLVTDKNTTSSSADLREFLKEKLPDYMIPPAFIMLDAFPLTPNGKLDRAALPEPEMSRDESRSFTAPRNEIELQLAQIWEKVMGIAPIGVTDNFFDLGGHSLLAVRLFSEITRVFGTAMPLAAIFQSPTIAELAQRVRVEGAAPVEGALVPIQPRGGKPPLFFVHAYGGGVFFYRELSDSLGQDQPFYGLQTIGLDGRRPPLRRVEDMAARYIEEMKTVQPRGPYYIGGRCLGAYIALEIANQLRAAGEEVGLLAVLDSYWAPQRPPTSGEKVGKHVSSLMHGGLREKLSYLSTHAGYRLLKTKLRLADIASTMAFRLGRPVPSFMRDFYINRYVPWLNGRAELRYAPQVYPGLITFFQATAESNRDPRSFWGKFTSEGIEVEMVPATHRDILVEPNVSVLADKLRGALEKARARTS
jgi:amino acid adenylation domain-containing protein